jgi:O-antigen/teichoic acid export membrane protein
VKVSSRAKLVKDILAAGLRHASTIVSGVITVALVARRCGADALGVWAMLAAMTLLLALCDMGLTTAVHRAAVARDEGRARRMVGLSLFAVVVVAPLAAAGSYAFLLDLPDSASLPLRVDASRASLLVLAGGVLGALTAPYRGFVLVRGGIQSLARARAVGAVTQVVVTCAGLYLAPTLIAPAAGLFLGLLLEGALTLRAARAIDSDLPRAPLLPESRAEIVQAFRDGSASLAINLAVAAAVRIDVFILARVSPLAIVAAYGVASRAVDQSFVFAKQASAALLPKLGDPRERDAAAELGTVVLGGLAASGLAALAICGAPLLVAWAGPMAATPPAKIALALLAFAAVLLASAEVVSSTLTLGARTPWEAARPIVLGAVVNVAISILGARAYGVWAVAGGTVVGNLIVTVMMWSRARLLLEWKAGRVARALAPVGAAGLVSLLSALALSGFAERGALWSLSACVMATAAGCAAALGASFLLRGVGGEIRVSRTSVPAISR